LQLIYNKNCYTLSSIATNGVVEVFNSDEKPLILSAKVGFFFKPILKIMSALSKEAPNFDGFYYTEIETIFGGAFLDFNWHWKGDSIACIFENSVNMYQSVPFEIFQYLFKTQF
jgi:hypothetical protein